MATTESSVAWINNLGNNVPVPGMDGGYTDRSGVPTVNGIERYSTDYYAGCQVAIFLGDLWLSDITSIQYQATQNKKPFWGYKSKKFDLVAQGTQLVEGVFSINYTHTNYMNMAISEWKKRTTPNSNGTNNVSEADIQSFLADLRNSTDPNKILNLQNSIGSTVAGKENSFAQYPTTSKQAILESYFWGASNNPDTQSVLAPDDLPPFDIAITFGNYPNDRLNPQNTDEFISAHTVRTVTGIHLTSSSMQMAITGEPQQEIFTFIARSIDTPLTRIPKFVKT
jgi:hypothetical protein